MLRTDDGTSLKKGYWAVILFLVIFGIVEKRNFSTI